MRMTEKERAPRNRTITLGDADIISLKGRLLQVEGPVTITFEREKGRGAKYNWKNSSEDIWFCSLSDDSSAMSLYDKEEFHLL